MLENIQISVLLNQQIISPETSNGSQNLYHLQYFRYWCHFMMIFIILFIFCFPIYISTLRHSDIKIYIPLGVKCISEKECLAHTGNFDNIFLDIFRIQVGMGDSWRCRSLGQLSLSHCQMYVHCKQSIHTRNGGGSFWRLGKAPVKYIINTIPYLLGFFTTKCLSLVKYKAKTPSSVML